MNALDRPALAQPADPVEVARLAVLQHFKVEDIQHHGQANLLFAQKLAGHGDTWGLWRTPQSIAPGRLGSTYRDLSIAQRLRDYLAKELVTSTTSLDSLINEGVLLLTRLALITRLVATSGRGHRNNERLKPSTIAGHLYQNWPRITARAIRRRVADPDAIGLFGCLTDSDVREFKNYKPTQIELDRLQSLVTLGLWADAPPLFDITRTLDPSGVPESRPPQPKPVPHPPIPDEYMAVIGPRVLWVIRDLGPNLLRLVEDLPVFLQTVDQSLSTSAVSQRVLSFIRDHQKQHPWQDRKGRPLVPAFRLVTASDNKSGHKVDELEWPPRTWSHIKILSQTLQSSHLFATLLASAGRIGEIDTLTRDTVVTARDGKDYLRGWTYKLSGKLVGDVRHWPAPEVLVQSLGQQARLAAAWNRLPSVLGDELHDGSSADGRLWVSLGTQGVSGAAGVRLGINNALTMLAERVGMDPKPGGKNLHAHRFRKTIGRLAGIALFNSPLVLKRLFGHKSIEMTLHYILCDPNIRSEAEKVLRELRIMHCAEALEEIHDAILSGVPLAANGGPGASRLVQAVSHEHERLANAGRLWDKGSAHDLAFLLTANGQGWRLIKENIVCSKVPGENGLCRQKRNKGEPNTSNCKPECDNRIVLSRQRRDVDAMARQYLDIARQAKEDGQILVLAHAMENLRTELDAFPDLKDKFLANHQVQTLQAYCEEIGA